MAQCFIQDGVVVNVGPWYYGEVIEVFTQDDYPRNHGAVIDGYWTQYPLPAGAVEVDLPLAKDAAGTYVLASDPTAVTFINDN